MKFHSHHPNDAAALAGGCRCSRVKQTWGHALWPHLALCFLLAGAAWAQPVEFSQISSPPGVVSQTTAHSPGSAVSTVTAPLTSGGTYSFTHWTLNGVRQNDPTGSGANPVFFTITVPTEAVANYTLTAQDSDTDTLADWYEIRYFGNLAQGPGDDFDADGFTNAQEIWYGQHPGMFDEREQGGVSRRRGIVFSVVPGVGDPAWLYGGVSRRRSATTLVIQNTALVRLDESSSPVGVLAQTRVETRNTTVNLSVAPDSFNGYRYTGWIVNGARYDVAPRNQPIPITLTGDVTMAVARYVPETADTDVDGIADWIEWYSFNSLQYTKASDPDGDGMTWAEEEARGYSYIVHDQLDQGGVSRRRGATLEVNPALNRVKFHLTGMPATIMETVVTPTTTLVLPGTMLTVPNLTNHSYANYDFAWWDLNGTRKEDPSGAALNQFSFVIAAESTATAHYVDPTVDTDGDGLLDWHEGYYYGTLANNGGTDTDGDGFTYAQEVFYGQSPRAVDTREQGGVSRRRGQSQIVNIVPLLLLPVIGENAATNITETTARLSTLVNPVGSPTTMYFDYGTSESYGQQTATQNMGTGGLAVSSGVELTGLTPGTTYHFRVVATNERGTSTSNDVTFQTAGISYAPIVTTLPATVLTSTTATLNATVNPNGRATTVEFQYGLTTAYFNAPVSLTLSPNNGTTAQAVSAIINGLIPGMSYHGRFVAMNANGVSYGTDLVFGRYPGASDVTFGTNGIATTALDVDHESAQGLAVQSDGKIVAAGYAKVGSTNRFALARYNSDGSLDTTFGTGGKVTTPFPGADAYGRSVAFQSDGKIVVAGYRVTTADQNSDFAVARYTTNGVLDTSFGTGGWFTAAFSINNEYAHDVAVQSDDKIVLGGRAVIYGEGLPRIALARCTSNGIVDETFDGDGLVITPIGVDDSARSVVIQPDGKILVAGYAGGAQDHYFALIRYTTTGQPDLSFGGNGTGYRLTGLAGGTDDYAYDLALQQDNKIIVVGTAFAGGVGDMAAVRYLPTGTEDFTFDGDGRAVYPLAAGNDEAYGVAVQRDGKIVVGGYANSLPSDFAVMRLTSAGVLDTTFNGAGTAITPVGSGNEVAYALALQADGAILLAGFSSNGTDNDFALVRYLGGLYLPSVTTLAATDVLPFSATLHGTANPNGLTTTGWFEYGTTTSYGQTTASSGVGYGTSAVNVAENIAGLSPNTLYHYRLAAQNGETTAYGADMTFTTLTMQQGWRQQHFGTTNNSGNAADTFDFDKDGLVNLIEWALGLNPTTARALPVTTIRNGTFFEFTYTRSVAALNAGAVFTVEWSDTLPGTSWSSTGVTEQVLSDNGTVQQVKASVPAGGGNRRFVHLKVTAPP